MAEKKKRKRSGKGQVRVNQHGFLYLDFYFRGIRLREGTKLKDTDENYKECCKLLTIIEGEILTGKFCYADHFPNGNKLSVFGPSAGTGTSVNKVDALDDYFREWMSDKIIRLSTRKMWESTYRCHIGSYLGNRLIDTIKTKDCRRVVSDAHLKKLCAGSVNKIIKLMKTVLKTAKDDGLISEDPSLVINYLTEFKTNVKPFTFEEIILILETAKRMYPHIYPFLATFVYTGMRPNELYALKWYNVDLKGGKIFVEEGRSLGEDTPPKTSSSQRDVYMIPMLSEILTEHKKTMTSPTDYVFKNTVSKPLCEQVVRRLWIKILDKAGIEKRRMYILRHTFATQALALGENPSWVSAMLGHTDAQITFRKYNRYVENLTRQDGSVLQQKYAELGNLQATLQERRA